MMTKIKRKTVAEKYDEISRLETFNERRKFLDEQSDEMRTALWLENLERKTKDMELSAEQKEIIAVIKSKFMTVEFAQAAKGKSEEEADAEYHEKMMKASQLFSKEAFRELFAILGDSSTLKSAC